MFLIVLRVFFLFIQFSIFVNYTKFFVHFIKKKDIACSLNFWLDYVLTRLHTFDSRITVLLSICSHHFFYYYYFVGAACFFRCFGKLWILKCSWFNKMENGFTEHELQLQLFCRWPRIKSIIFQMHAVLTVICMSSDERTAFHEKYLQISRILNCMIRFIFFKEAKLNILKAFNLFTCQWMMRENELLI